MSLNFEQLLNKPIGRIKYALSSFRQRVYLIFKGGRKRDVTPVGMCIFGVACHEH